MQSTKRNHKSSVLPTEQQLHNLHNLLIYSNTRRICKVVHFKDMQLDAIFKDYLN